MEFQLSINKLNYCDIYVYVGIFFEIVSCTSINWMCTIWVQSYGICTQFCVISLCDFAVVSYVHHSMWYVCVTCVRTHGLFLLLKCWVHWWFVWQVCVMCASDSTPKLLFCFSCEHHAHLHIYVTQMCIVDLR